MGIRRKLMSFLSLFPRRRVRTTPELLAASIIPLAARHAESLQETLQGEIDADLLQDAFLELLRAYFCLASICVVFRLENEELRNRYGSMILKSLCEYPDPELPLVRVAFEETASVDEALQYYIHDRPTTEEKNAITDWTRFAQLKEDNPIYLIAVKLDVRLSRILGTPIQSVEYLSQNMVMHVDNAAFVTAAARFFSRINPVLE